MNRAQLTAQIAEKTGVSKAQAGKLLNTVLGCIADNICEGDGEVAIPDFGRFYIKSCQARTGFNPLKIRGESAARHRFQSQHQRAY